jgi:xanthine/CO dehydrogenase XdhC/CoxF family maturation factor
VSDLDKILALWQAAHEASEDYVLASIVRVEGSSYRKPGARMLITETGQRAGTISGGCLEAEVAKQAWWLTRNGPVVKTYTTSLEMDEDAPSEADADRIRPYGLGCGGVIHLLLERRATADVFLREIHRSFQQRTPVACSVVLEGSQVGLRAFAPPSSSEPDSTAGRLMYDIACKSLRDEASFTQSVRLENRAAQAWVEYIPPRCGLFIFGAGDDAQPLVVQANTLGWHIAVADGRSHLATKARFPEAHRVVILEQGDLSGLDLHAGDAAVVMTHSFAQDSKLLAHLLPRPLLYLGVLGPRYRTVELLKQVVPSIGGTVTEWMQKLYAPVGFDLGADSPATIALSILAEVQATLRWPRAVPMNGLNEQPDSALKTRLG